MAWVCAASTSWERAEEVDVLVAESDRAPIRAPRRGFFFPGGRSAPLTEVRGMSSSEHVGRWRRCPVLGERAGLVG